MALVESVLPGKYPLVVRIVKSVPKIQSIMTQAFVEKATQEPKTIYLAPKDPTNHSKAKTAAFFANLENSKIKYNNIIAAIVYRDTFKTKAVKALVKYAKLVRTKPNTVAQHAHQPIKVTRNLFKVR